MKLKLLKKKNVAARTVKLLSAKDGTKFLFIDEYKLGEYTGFPDEVVETLFDALDEEMLKKIHHLLWQYSEDLMDILREVIYKEHPEFRKELKKLKLTTPLP